MTISFFRWPAVVAAAALLCLAPVAALSATSQAPVRIAAKGVSHPHIAAGRFVSLREMLAVSARDSANPVRSAAKLGTQPFYTRLSHAAYLRAKQAALHNLAAPMGRNPIQPSFSSPGPNMLMGAGSFEGLADSGFICSFFGTGCQPPDMALAASPSHVLQVVNTSAAVFNPATQTEEFGWPMQMDSFLGGGPSSIVGTPGGSGCDPNGPFLSDPRAFYDTHTGHFWVSIGQFDGVDFIGDSCPDTSIIWWGVSKDSNPADGFFVYHFDDSFGGAQLGDFPTMGFDDASDAIEMSANDFSFTAHTFTGSPVLYIEKAGMEAGTGPTAATFYNDIFCFGGPCGSAYFLDTIQPADMLAFGVADPGVDISNSAENFNANGGAGCGNPSPCTFYLTFAVVNPFDGTFTNGSNVQATNINWVLPPNADVTIPGGFCTACVETLDNRISATMAYNARFHSVTFANETGLNNGTQVVPAVIWSEETAILSSGPTLSTGLRQQNDIFGSGDLAVSFGSTMTEKDGDAWILTDLMSATLNPGAQYQEREFNDPLNTLRAPILLRASAGPDILEGRWGDYEALSYDGTNMWLASQYIGGGGDWATQIGHNH
jgi:hypothetical protein